jgi:hypothetical protein
MKPLTQYLRDLRELVRERIRTLSEYDRTERKYDESLRRHYSKPGGKQPTIVKGRGLKLPDREE